MLIWFISIGILGLRQILVTPAILEAFNPYFAFDFIMCNKTQAFLAIAGVFLVVTGAEALYADLGHFSKKSIQLSWNLFVFPALLLNYLGQGSLLLRQPEMISNPFYNLVNGVEIYPLIILSTTATIIASQSIISGVFSVSSQAIKLKYLPKLKVLHTSDNKAGQVYVPSVNFILYILTVCAILKFQNSSNLSSAYGLSVSGVMLITTILVLFVSYYQWGWNLIKLTLVFVPLLFLDFVFLIVNLTKLFEGAWYTITITIVVSIIMWKIRLSNESKNIK
jgi:KUP system potassium uptake protein